MNIAIWEISIIVALSIIFFIILRRLPQAQNMLKQQREAPTTTKSIQKPVPVREKPSPPPKPNIVDKIAEIQKLIELNRLSGAEKQLLDLVVTYPKEGEIYEKLGLVYLKQGSFSDCVEALQEALKYKTDASGLIYNNLGLAYFNLKEYYKSIEYYRKSIDLDKHSINRYVNLALAQKALGRAGDAMRTLKRAEKINPHDPDVQKLLKSLG